MGDSTLDSELFYLLDNWPGAVDPNQGVPKDGFTGSEHHNVAAAAYPVGTKVRVYNTGTTGEPGWATMVYLQVGTQNANELMAARTIVVHDSATNWYKITNDPDGCIALVTGAAAIALSAMTDAYFGWFWCAGVCPEEFVSGLGGNYLTADGLVAGAFTAHDRTDDFIGFGPAIAADAAAVQPVLGYALAADA